MDKKLIARRIYHYRKEVEKVTQEDLAEAVGVSDTYIRKLEAGERTPSLKLIMLLATALNTTPDHLLLPVSNLEDCNNCSIMELLKDCTPIEFAILCDNMIELKALLRKHLVG